MSKKRPAKRKTSSTSIRNKLLGSIVVAFLFGSIFGYVLIQPQMDDLETNEVVLRSEINFLNTRINELEIKESELSVSKNTIETLENKTLRFIAVGACSDHFGHWNEQVLKNIREKIDELSVHYYSIRTEKDKNPPNYKTRYLPTVAAATEVELMLDKTINEVRKNTNKDIKIAFDEWNTYVEAHTPYFIENYNIADAIYGASLLHACINRGDIIRNTGIYHLINVMGNYRICLLYTSPSPRDS